MCKGERARKRGVRNGAGFHPLLRSLHGLGETIIWAEGVGSRPNWRLMGIRAVNEGEGGDNEELEGKKSRRRLSFLLHTLPGPLTGHFIHVSKH